MYSVVSTLWSVHNSNFFAFCILFWWVKFHFRLRRSAPGRSCYWWRARASAGSPAPSPTWWRGGAAPPCSRLLQAGPIRVRAPIQGKSHCRKPLLTVCYLLIPAWWRILASMSSNVKSERSNVPISFRKRNRSRICLVENRLFRLGPRSALLDQIEMCSFDGADSETYSDILVSFLLDFRTFAERLWNLCSFTVLTLLSMSLRYHKLYLNYKLYFCSK